MGTAVLFEVHDHVATVTLNRPEKKNAINRAMRKEVQEAFSQIKHDPEIWVAIITGSGEVFCSGKDLLEKLPDQDSEVMSNDELYLYLRFIYKPIVIALNGTCPGGRLRTQFGHRDHVRAREHRLAAGQARHLLGERTQLHPARRAMEPGHGLSDARPVHLGCRCVPIRHCK